MVLPVWALDGTDLPSEHLCPLSEHPGHRGSLAGLGAPHSCCMLHALPSPWYLLQGRRTHGLPARSLEPSPQSAMPIPITSTFEHPLAACNGISCACQRVASHVTDPFSRAGHWAQLETDGTCSRRLSYRVAELGQGTRLTLKRVPLATGQPAEARNPAPDPQRS